MIRSKIKNKFLIPILVLQLVALAALGYVGYRFSSNMLRNHAEKQFKKTISAVYNGVERDLEIRLGKIRHLLRSPVFVKFSAADYYKSDVDAEVFSFQKGNGLVLGEPEVGGLVNFPVGLLANEGGRRVVDMGLFPSVEYVGMDGLVKQHVYLGGSNDLDFEVIEVAKLDRSSEKWFQVASKGDVYIGRPTKVKLFLREYQPITIETKDMAIEKELISIALPHVLGRNTVGILMVTTTPDFIYDFMPEGKEASLVLVLDAEGEVIAQRGKLLHAGDTIASFKPMLKQGEGSIFDYADHLIMHRTSSISGWSIAMIGEKDDIFAGVYRLRGNILLIMTVSILFMGGIVYLIIRKLLMPILHLKEASDKIAGGELGVTIGKTTDDEIGKLTDSFNQMSVRTKDMHDRLEASNVRLSNLNFIRRQMLHIISHELRTPISNVIGFYELLREQMREGRDSLDYEDFKDSFGLMGQGIDKCEKLVGRLTRATSVMADEIREGEEDFEPSSLVDVVAKTVEDLKRYATDRNIGIIYNPKEDCLVACPPRALSLLIEEALSNAIKYSPDNSGVEVDCDVKDREIEISIRDHGCGIPKAYINDVVEPFFEVADAKHHFTDRFRKGGGGLSLGFTIILNILKRYDGRFQIDSVPDQGTTLTLILPVFKNVIARSESDEAI